MCSWSCCWIICLYHSLCWSYCCCFFSFCFIHSSWWSCFMCTVCCSWFWYCLCWQFNLSALHWVCAFSLSFFFSNSRFATTSTFLALLLSILALSFYHFSNSSPLNLVAICSFASLVALLVVVIPGDSLCLVAVSTSACCWNYCLYLCCCWTSLGRWDFCFSRFSLRSCALLKSLRLLVR